MRARDGRTRESKVPSTMAMRPEEGASLRETGKRQGPGSSIRADFASWSRWPGRLVLEVCCASQWTVSIYLEKNPVCKLWKSETLCLTITGTLQPCHCITLAQSWIQRMNPAQTPRVLCLGNADGETERRRQGGAFLWHQWLEEPVPRAPEREEPCAVSHRSPVDSKHPG